MGRLVQTQSRSWKEIWNDNGGRPRHWHVRGIIHHDRWVLWIYDINNAGFKPMFVARFSQRFIIIRSYCGWRRFHQRDNRICVRSVFRSALDTSSVFLLVDSYYRRPYICKENEIHGNNWLVIFWISLNTVFHYQFFLKVLTKAWGNWTEKWLCLVNAFFSTKSIRKKKINNADSQIKTKVLEMFVVLGKKWTHVYK